MIKLKQKDKAKAKLNKLRIKIDRIDNNIIKELHKRWVVLGKVKKLKKISGIKIVDDGRMKNMESRHSILAKKYSVPDYVVQHVFNIVLRESVKYQKGK